MTKPQTDVGTTWKVQYRLAEPFITKKQVKAITKKATKWQKLRLLFKPSHYSIDGKAIIRYKWLDGVCYVMKKGTKL